MGFLERELEKRNVILAEYDNAEKEVIAIKEQLVLAEEKLSAFENVDTLKAEREEIKALLGLNVVAEEIAVEPEIIVAE
jgi:hypothetical protein